jgi:hypothetical protein
MTAPLTKEYLEEFGDPGLTLITDQIRAAREELSEANDKYEFEHPDAEESRYLDRQNAAQINRKLG